MTIALRPDEQARLEALARYEVLDTPRERDFDDIAELASEICGAPIAVVNLIGDGRQFFKAEVGLGVRETPLETSFCGHAILAEDFMIVPDATRDARFDCNPLVTGDPGLRFYAGALLKTPEGLPLGTLCVLDYEARELTEQQAGALRKLARQVMTQLELRRTLRLKAQDEAYLRTLLNSTSEGFYSVDTEGNTTLCNDAFVRLLGFENQSQVIGRKLHDVIHHSHPDGSHYPVGDCPIYRCASTGRPAHVADEMFYPMGGGAFPVEYWVHPIVVGGVLQGAICTFIDVTERLASRRALVDLNDQLRTRVAEVEAERDRTEMLGREIDHRVMNSLQFISALLAMQAKAAGDAEAARQLDIAATRVTAVARVHRHFYLDDRVETISALDYMRRLMADLAGVIEPAVATVEGEPTPMATTLVMALGLIANELVTNAAKHGASRIAVGVEPAGGGVRLTVGDDGPGLPADFTPAARTGLGMRVVQSLVRQHAGTLAYGPGEAGGTLFSVTLG